MGVAAHAEGGPLLEALLAAGARPDATDDVGDTALNVATRSGNGHAVTLLLRRIGRAKPPNPLLGMAPHRRADARAIRT
jgi:ankyrin repeat protein